MREIPLTQGRVALVDDDVYEYLMQWKWCANRYPNTIYATRSINLHNGSSRTVRMHREIMKFYEGDSSLEVDHIDRNGLNNTRANLRYVTKRGNSLNRKGLSKFPGVSFMERVGKFRARARVNGKNRHIGYFPTPEQASEAYWKFVQEARQK